jgi:hypothetical protein
VFEDSVFHRIWNKTSEILLKGKGRRFGCSDASEMVCYRCLDRGMQRVPPTRRVEAGDRPLPEELLISPGTYTIGQGVFPFTEEGVYRCYALGRVSEQRIVWSSDVSMLLSFLGWLWVYGNRDDPLSLRHLRREILHHRVVVSCTPVSFLCHRILKDAGVTSRVVACLTLEPWNAFENGHTMIEIRNDASGWFLYDPSFRCRFKKRERNLGLLDFVQHVRSNQDYGIESLDGGQRTGPFRISDYDFGFRLEHQIGSEEELRRWYSRIAWVPLVFESGHYFFTGDPEIKKRVLSYSPHYRYVEADAFMKRFFDSPRNR